MVTALPCNGIFFIKEKSPFSKLASFGRQITYIIGTSFWKIVHKAPPIQHKNIQLSLGKIVIEIKRWVYKNRYIFSFISIMLSLVISSELSLLFVRELYHYMYKMSIIERKLSKIYRKLTKKRELKVFVAKKRKRIILIRMKIFELEINWITDENMI